MKVVAALSIGALVGFAVFALGPAGVAGGVAAGVLYAAPRLRRHDRWTIGVLVAAAAATVMILAGRIVVEALVDPAVAYDPGLLAWLVGAALVFAAGVAWAALTSPAWRSDR